MITGLLRDDVVDELSRSGNGKSILRGRGIVLLMLVVSIGGEEFFVCCIKDRTALKNKR